MKHYGDVSKINGSKVEPVDVITFGSPCQDLSVAGKRAGNNCDICKHKLSGECEAADFGCERCTRDCKCKTCRDNSNWEFL